MKDWIVVSIRPVSFLSIDSKHLDHVKVAPLVHEMKSQMCIVYTIHDFIPLEAMPHIHVASISTKMDDITII